MNKEKEITEIADGLKKYRESAQELVDANLIFLSKIAKKLAELKFENTDVHEEVKKYNTELFHEVKEDIEKCLTSLDVYTKSLEEDYGTAIKKLTKLKKDL